MYRYRIQKIEVSNAYNFKSPVFTVAIISSSDLTIPDIQIPITGTYQFKDENGIQKNLCGAIDLGQIKTIGKERIVLLKVCDLKNEMQEIDNKLLNIIIVYDSDTVMIGLATHRQASMYVEAFYFVRI